MTLSIGKWRAAFFWGGLSLEQAFAERQHTFALPWVSRRRNLGIVLWVPDQVTPPAAGKGEQR